MAIISIVNKAKLEVTKRIDAEYYQPKYISASQTLHRNRVIPLSRVSSISDGNHLKIASQFQEFPGIRYLRGQDVSPEMVIHDRNKIYVPEEIYYSIERAHIKRNDILVTIVGANTGLIGLAYDIPEKICASCKLGIARAFNLHPGYLYSFLISKYGQFQILRNKRGGGQTGLILPDMRNLLIPDFSDTFKDKVGQLAYDGHEEIMSSKSIDYEANNVLLSELGVGDWKPSNSKTFIRKLTSSIYSRRLDAEHFQPKFDEILELIERFSPRRLKNYGTQIFDIVKFDDTKKYRYIEIGDVNVTTGEVWFTERDVLDLPPNAKIKVKGGELIISKVRPTRGAVGIVPDECINNGVCSSAFTVMNIHSPYREFLQLYLRSIVGKLLLEKYCKGTSYPTIEDIDVRNLPVPTMEKSIIQTISNLVVASQVKRRRAKMLLGTAKQAVEIAVEEGEDAAFGFINNCGAKLIP